MRVVVRCESVASSSGARVGVERTGSACSSIGAVGLQRRGRGRGCGLRARAGGHAVLERAPALSALDVVDEEAERTHDHAREVEQVAQVLVERRPASARASNHKAQEHFAY